MKEAQMNLDVMVNDGVAEAMVMMAVVQGLDNKSGPIDPDVPTR